MSIRIHTWSAECVNRAKNQNKFYKMFVVEDRRDGFAEFVALSMNGRIGMTGFPRTKLFSNEHALEKFKTAKVSDGYVVTHEQTIETDHSHTQWIEKKYVDYFSIKERAQIVKDLKILPTKDDLEDMFLAQAHPALGGGAKTVNKAHAKPKTAEKVEPKPVQKIITPAERYGSAWGAF